MSRQTQSYDDKAIRGEELESLATSIAQKIVDNGQVVADALDELDARTRALENRNPDVLGDAVADSLDTQVLKIGGQPIDTSAFEQVSNKVSAWQSTPDNTHYPSEKLVKDGLDAKADANKVVAIADAFVLRRGQVGQGWYKLAETTTPRANYNINSVFDVVLSSNSGECRGSFVMSVRYEGTGEVNVFTKSLFSDAWFSDYPIKIVTTKVSSTVLKVELYFGVKPSVTTNAVYSGISISEQNAGNYGGTNEKNAWTYTSYTDVAGSAEPEPDPTSNKEVVDVKIVARQLAIANPTNDNLVAMNANGLVKDSGKKATDFVQSVKIGSGSELKDASGNVVLPVDSTPTASSTNLMTSGDIKTALDLKADASDIPNFPNENYTFAGNKSGTDKYKLLATVKYVPIVGEEQRVIFDVVLGKDRGAIECGSLEIVIRNDQTSGYVYYAKLYKERNVSGFTLVATYKDDHKVYIYAKSVNNSLGSFAIKPVFASGVYNSREISATVDMAASGEIPSGVTPEGTAITITTYVHSYHDGTAKGSTSVPVYVKATGEIDVCTDDFARDSEVVSSVQVETASNTTKMTYTKNGSKTDILEFMTTAEARSVWTNAKAAVANAS